MSEKSSIFEGVSPKLSFIMGLIVGVGAISLVGFIVAISFSFVGGFKDKNVNSAQPVAVNNNTNNQAANQPSAPTGPVNITLKADDYIRGTKGAPLTMVEYTDLECPYCKQFHNSMEQLMKDYPGKIAWVYRNYPLSFHANSQKEAEAAECVGKLGGNDKFWQFVDGIFARTTSNGTGFALDKLGALAKEVGVNQTSFQSCLDSGQMSSDVSTDLQEGTQYGVSGTPTTFVNGQAVEGAVPYSQLKSIVDKILSKQ